MLDPPLVSKKTGFNFNQSLKKVLRRLAMNEVSDVVTSAAPEHLAAAVNLVPVSPFNQPTSLLSISKAMA